MIVVLGASPRSGTSLLMAMLTAGGLDPVRNDDGELSPGHPVGSFQHSEVLLDHTATVLQGLVHERSCVKLFTRHIIDLAALGLYPQKVILTSRPLEESLASWDRVWPERSTQRAQDALVGMVERATDLLREANIPILTVPFHDLIDRPAVQANRIAKFVGGLDAAAMAAIPSAEHRHFGGPPPA